MRIVWEAATILLREDRWFVNFKTVYRLWCQEGLKVHRKQHKKLKATSDRMQEVSGRPFEILLSSGRLSLGKAGYTRSLGWMSFCTVWGANCAICDRCESFTPPICYYKRTCVIAGLFLRSLFNVGENGGKIEFIPNSRLCLAKPNFCERQAEACIF